LSVQGERFISAFKTKNELFPQHGPIPVFTALSERVLDFIHLVLTTPALKDHTIHGPGGISSFEVALTQIIAFTGPHPPEAAAAAPPPPPAQSATRPVPSPPDVACVLKHVCHLLPVMGLVPIKAEPATSTSFLKVVDIPLVAAAPREWQLAQCAAFNKALALSPVGSQLSRYIKHAPRFMRTSPHADTCVAWVDISDTISGATAKMLVSKCVAFGNANCQIQGAAPWPGSTLCTRCLKWGHHSSVCRSKGIRCPHCGGPHSAASHDTQAEAVNQDPAARRCVNCSAAKKSKTNHSATDTTCPFWEHCFDWDWLKRQRVAKKQQ
jgi:hypothetical protein